MDDNRLEMDDHLYEITEAVKNAIERLSNGARAVNVILESVQKNGAFDNCGLKTIQTAVYDMARATDSLFDWRDAQREMLVPGNYRLEMQLSKQDRIETRFKAEIEASRWL